MLADHNVGDLVDVCPQYCPCAWNDLLNPNGQAHEDVITVCVSVASILAAGERHLAIGDTCLNVWRPICLWSFVSAQSDLRSTIRRRFFLQLACLATDDMQRKRLESFASAEDTDDFTQSVDPEKRTSLMVLWGFSSTLSFIADSVNLMSHIWSRAYLVTPSFIALGNCIHIFAGIYSVSMLSRLFFPLRGRCVACLKVSQILGMCIVLGARVVSAVLTEYLCYIGVCRHRHYANESICTGKGVCNHLEMYACISTLARTGGMLLQWVLAVVVLEGKTEQCSECNFKHERP